MRAWLVRFGAGCLCVVALGAGLGFGLGGCYQKTVDARGFGTDGIPREEGDLRTGKDRRPLDRVGDAVFGPVE